LRELVDPKHLHTRVDVTVLDDDDASFELGGVHTEAASGRSSAGGGRSLVGAGRVQTKQIRHQQLERSKQRSWKAFLNLYFCCWFYFKLSCLYNVEKYS